MTFIEQDTGPQVAAAALALFFAAIYLVVTRKETSEEEKETTALVETPPPADTGPVGSRGSNADPDPLRGIPLGGRDTHAGDRPGGGMGGGTVEAPSQAEDDPLACRWWS